MKRLVLAAALGAAWLVAGEAKALGPTPYDACFARAGNYYGINPLLLKAIARQESSMNPRAIGQNTNGTQDLGIMQINTWHLPKLAKAGITRQHLMDPCINIYVGAWVLADAVRRFGMSWKAVGVYHSPTDWRQRNYAAKVHRHLIREIEGARAWAARSGQPVLGLATQAAPVAAAPVQHMAPAGVAPVQFAERQPEAAPGTSAVRPAGIWEAPRAAAGAAGVSAESAP